MQSVPAVFELNLNVHSSGENRRQRYSKSGHFNDVVILERDVGKERITKMVPFKYFFWSALFGGIIGGICGVMLTFKIYVNGNEEPEEPAEDPNEEELQPAIQEEMILVREPVEHDERTERSY